jgi:hypothetical protein
VALTCRAQTTFRFTLDKSYLTSAGAFRSDGKLVRTLWQKVPYTAGTQQYTWDGLDDAGQRVPAGTYQIKVMAHNVQYVWEGVIGNTSDSFTTNIWRSLLTPADMSFAPSGESYTALGYNEGAPGLVYNPAGTVQAPRKVLEHDFNEAYAHVCTDGTYLYAASTNSGFDDLQSSFVIRFAQATKAQAPWSEGKTASYGGTTRAGVVSLRQSPAPVQYDPANEGATKRAAWLQNRITGLAVNDNYLAVARKAQNTVQFYNKATGGLLGSLAVAAPGQVAFAANGNLWVISAGQVKQYSVRSGTSFTLQNTLTGISEALALDAHPSQDLLLVADGGDSQQIKAYDGLGRVQWAHGQKGGYPTLGPTVSYDKFWFVINDPLSNSPKPTDRDQMGDPFTFIKWQPDGTFWILDTANLRILHFSANRTYLNQIASLPDRLQLAGDQNNPTRVFSGNLEFQVSLAPLQPGDPSLSANPSWVLRKNWGAGLDQKRYGTLVNVATHTNGRTYGQIRDNATNEAGYMGVRTQLVELPANGQLRFTGSALEDYGNGGFSYEQMPSGDLICGRVDTRKYNYDAGGDAELRCEKRILTGYDSNNNPQYGPVETVWALRSRLYRGNDPFFDKPVGARIRLPRTANGNYVTYQPRKRNLPGDFHLGTVAPGTTTDWVSRFHQGKVIQRPDGKGSYPEIEAYGGWDGANVYADGKDIVALYNGQNNTTSNTFSHFTQDGLLVNEFGVPSTNHSDSYSPPGMAGNNIDMYMIRPSANTLHVYTVDESAHAGLHRWRVEGTTGIREFTGSGALGSTISLTSASAAPLPVELTAFAASRAGSAVSCRWETASEKDSDYFVVERSADGTTYSAIAKVASATTSTTKLSYNYLDAQPLASTAYYRLRLVDQDGTESFSPVAVLASISSDEPLTASVAPNPGSGLFELSTTTSSLVEANVYDLLGKHLCRLLPTAAHTQRLPFNLTTYPVGVYVIRVQLANGATTVRVVKNN